MITWPSRFGYGFHFPFSAFASTSSSEVVEILINDREAAFSIEQRIPVQS